MSTQAAQPSAPAGPMNLAEAANALEGILPVDGEQSPEETQLSESDEDDGAALSEELSADADAADEETQEEQSEEDEESEEQDQPTVFTVKVDGKEVEVTLDELQKGYSRTQDYTRKTQQIAEIRKQVEVETEAVRAERAQYAQMLGALQAQLQGTETQIDWDRLYHEDPIEWVRQKEVMRERQEKFQAIQFEQQRMAQLSQHEQQQQLASHLQEQHTKLLEIIPEWKDPVKAKAEKQLLVEFGQKTGFTPEELKAIVDHRAVVALRKAALYDQMMTKRKAITPVTNNGPRPAKPGAAGRVSQTTEAVRAKQRLAKTGRVDDAASAIYQLLR
jgi:hypothetical protein